MWRSVGWERVTFFVAFATVLSTQLRQRFGKSPYRDANDRVWLCGGALAMQ